MWACADSFLKNWQKCRVWRKKPKVRVLLSGAQSKLERQLERAHFLLFFKRRLSFHFWPQNFPARSESASYGTTESTWRLNSENPEKMSILELHVWTFRYAIPMPCSTPVPSSWARYSLNLCLCDGRNETNSFGAPKCFSNPFWGKKFEHNWSFYFDFELDFCSEITFFWKIHANKSPYRKERGEIVWNTF